MYGVASGSVAEMDVTTGEARFICALNDAVGPTISAAGRLWFSRFKPNMGSYLVGLDPTNCNEVEFYSGAAGLLSEPIGDLFFVANQKFNASTRTFSPGPASGAIVKCCGLVVC